MKPAAARTSCWGVCSRKVSELSTNQLCGTVPAINPDSQTTSGDSTSVQSATVPGAHFRYLRWVAITIVTVAAGSAVAAMLLPSAAPLSGEGGVIEFLSWILWAIAVVLSLCTCFRWRERADRLTAAWMAFVALMAGLRELDAHVYLNPDYFGGFGVRYRMDWWLDGNVSPWLKLGWLAVAFVVLVFVIYIPWTVRLPVFRMACRGDAMVALFFLAIPLLGIGFVMDDTLRGTKLIPPAARQVIEETSELLGATMFLASAWLRWRFPLAAHLRTVGLSDQRAA